MIKIINLKVTNCYLIPVDNQYLLVDTGYQTEWDEFCNQLKKNDIYLNDIEYILLTHHHNDHSSLLNKIILFKPSIKIITSELGKQYLKKGRHIHQSNSGYTNKRIANIMKIKRCFSKNSHTFPIFNIRHTDMIIKDGSNLLEYGINLSGKIVHTPGHSKDSISLFLNTGECFCGDVCSNISKLLGLKYCPISVDCFNELYNSWNLLINNNVQYLFPAHGKKVPISKIINNLYKKNRKCIVSRT